jgi:hypothetical protein
MKLDRKASALLCATILLLVGLARAATGTPATPLTWQDFWHSIKVSPPPPRDFLDGKYTGEILNLAGGKLSDATVRKWVLADLRRGRGDSWALNQLRLDVANAGIFGPPGLEPLPPGLVRWQLDAGKLRDVPPLGPVWYQERGWTCTQGGKSAVDEVCGMAALALSK